MYISNGFLINFLQIRRTSGLIVAENIITCLLWGVILKIDWTSYLISNSESILSHSSRTKCFRFSIFKCYPLTNANILPGVPTRIVGGAFLRDAIWSLIAYPPYITSHETLLVRCLVNLSYSFLIWYANSRVWHITKTVTPLGASSSWWRVVRTKTAVLPIPDFA